MPEYLSPGVYVEEVDAGPKPIEGVSTSTAGAVGVTTRGPTEGKPELVTSYADFVRVFGGTAPEPPANVRTAWGASGNLEGGRWWSFGLAVKGFFDNGGQRLYVKRVFSGDATFSSAALGQGFATEIESDAAHDPTAPAAPLQLKLRHLVGITNGANVQVINGSTGNPIGGGFTVDSYDQRTRRVTLNPGLAANQEVRERRGDFVRIHPAVANPTLQISAAARGQWGDAIRVRVRPMVGAVMNILHDPNIAGGAPTTTVANVAVAGGTVTVTVPSAAGGAPPTLTGFADDDHIDLGGREFKIDNVNPAGDTFDLKGTFPATTTWPSGTPIRRLRVANDPAGANADQINIWGAPQLYVNAVVELDNGSAKEVRTVVSVAGDTVTLSAPLANTYFEGHRLRVVEAEVNVQYRPNGQLEAEETFAYLRLRDTPAGSLSYIVTHINEQSKLIRCEEPAAALALGLAQFPNAASGGWLALANGNDRLDSLAPDDFVGVDGGSGRRTGILALEDIDEISICTVPGVWSRTVHNALISHCELLKDRFAIIDPAPGLDIEGIRSFREVYDTKYAALYYPWVTVRDPATRRDTDLAPSAHMAGIYARTDNERGVHKAPANVVIRNITRIAQDVTKREQDMLNPKNINVLRFFPGRGNRVWGARCITSDAAWKYVNVRRLFIMVEESIDEGTQWVVFEPNYEPTWARVRQSVSNFLTRVWQSGALEGTTPEEAFFVKCDRTTMTQDDIDNGRLICVVGIAPVKPAEFVIFRIQQKTRDAVTA